MSMSQIDIILSSTSLQKRQCAHLSIHSIYLLIVILLAKPNHSLGQRGTRTSTPLRLYITLAFHTLVLFRPRCYPNRASLPKRPSTNVSINALAEATRSHSQVLPRSHLEITSWSSVSTSSFSDPHSSSSAFHSLLHAGPSSSLSCTGRFGAPGFSVFR